MKKIILLLTIIVLGITLSGCTANYLQAESLSAYQIGNNIRSKSLLEDAIGQQSDNPNLYFLLGQNYVAVNDYASAIDNFKKAIELSTGGKIDSDDMNLVQISNTNKKTYSKTQDAATGKTINDATLGDYYVWLAKSYFSNTEYTKAANTLLRLNETDASICLKKQFTDECIAIYDYSNKFKEEADIIQRAGGDNISQSLYVLIKQHDYDKVQRVANIPLMFDPGTEMPYYYLGLTSGLSGDSNKATEALRKAVQNAETRDDEPFLDKSNKPVFKVNYAKYLPIYTTLAYYSSLSGDYNAAIAAYNDAITKINNHKVFSYIIRTTQNYNSNSGLSYTAPVIKTLDLIYNTYDSLMALSLLYYNAGRYPEALNEINSYIAKAGTNASGLYISHNTICNYTHYVFSTTHGSAAEKAGLQFKDKIIKINNVLITNKLNDDVAKLLADAQGQDINLTIKRQIITKDEKKGKDKKTTITMEKIIKNEPPIEIGIKNRLAKGYGLRSLIYRAMGNYDSAYIDAQKAISYNPNDFNAKLAFGFANLSKGKYNDAVKILSSTKIPNNERNYRFQNVFMNNANYIFTVTPFPTDIQLAPIGISIAYLKQGKLDDALDYIPSKEIPESFGALGKEYGLLSVELDKISQADEEKAKTLQERGFLGEALNQYKIALNYTNNDDKEDEIITNIVNLLKEYPLRESMSEEARKHSVRADVFVSQGKMDNAMEETLKALKQSPSVPKFYYNIAVGNANMKNYTKAIKYMNFYIKLNPKASDVQEAKDNITKWELLQEN